MKLTENLNVVDVLPLISPEILKENLPLSETASENVTNARKEIQQILVGKERLRKLEEEEERARKEKFDEEERIRQEQLRIKEWEKK